MALPESKRKRVFVAPEREPGWIELRCVVCARWLMRFSAEATGLPIVIKCHRCKTLQERVLMGDEPPGAIHNGNSNTKGAT